MPEQTAGSLGLCGPDSMARERERLGLPPVGVTRAEPQLDDDDPDVTSAPPSLPETAKRARDGSPFAFDPDTLPQDRGEPTAHQTRNAAGPNHVGACTHPPQITGAMLEAQHGGYCQASVPDPSRDAAPGARVKCRREPDHLLGSSPYVDSQTPTDDAHVGPSASGSDLAWWDGAEGAISHRDALQGHVAPRLFVLERDRDVSQVSGTGRVAWGVEWPDGTAAVRWISDSPTVAVHDSMQSVEAIHGHGGATRIVFM